MPGVKAHKGAPLKRVIGGRKVNNKKELSKTKV